MLPGVGLRTFCEVFARVWCRHSATIPRMTPDHLVCYICGLPSTQSRHAGEMCTLCADAFDSNDVKTLINRSAEGTAVHHDAAPGDDSRYCAVCRHEIYRLGTDGWRHN